ncbi:MAG: tetratricopeptide repeat protein [Chthoniobacterales bacterium]
MKTSSILIVLLLLPLGVIAQTLKLAPVPAAVPAPAPAGPTVKILMKDGTSLDVPSLRRDGSMIMVPLAAGVGEVGYAVSKIARVAFPAPTQIVEAEGLLADGKAEEAMIKVEPILAFYTPFRDIPGNFWQATAFLKMKALLALQRSKDAETLLNQIAASAGVDPLIADRVQVEKAAILTRQGKDKEALTIYDQIIEKSTDPDTLASAWLNKGQSLLALKEYDPAVIAFLHVPVFYANQVTLQPTAMLGAARAWRGLTDVASAEASMRSLIEKYPTSPEASIAEKEIKQL